MSTYLLRPGTTTALVAMAALAASALILTLMMTDRSDANLPADVSAGYVGETGYSLTGTISRVDGRAIVVGSAIVRGDTIYLVYSMTEDGSQADEQNSPDFIISTGAGAGDRVSGFELMRLDDVRVGVLEVPLTDHPTEYRLSIGDSLTSPTEADVVFRSSAAAGGGTIVLNAESMRNAESVMDEFGYRTVIEAPAVYAPDIAATLITVTSSSGASEEAAIAIGEDGVLRMISRDELDQLLKKYTR